MPNKVIVGIISKDENPKQYLLMSSTRDFGEFSGFFYPPGGHIDGTEDEKTALAREIKEELGLDIVPVSELAVTDGDIANQITHWWECKIIGSVKIMPDKDEVAEVKWFSKDDILNSDIVWPATKKFFETYIQ